MKLTIALLFILLTGCVGLPTPQEAARADYGTFPDNHESIVKAHLNRLLKDPSSVVYGSFSYPKIYWLGTVMDGAQYGYLVCANYNAKNSYGGYAGYTTDGFLIRDGMVIVNAPDGIFWTTRVCN